MKISLTIAFLVFMLSGCGDDNLAKEKEEYRKNAAIAQENRAKYRLEIHHAFIDCLKSVRANPNSQNYNDDNEVVETCRDYSLRLYQAKTSIWDGSLN